MMAASKSRTIPSSSRITMLIQSTSAKLTQIEADAVVIGIFNDKQLGTSAKAVNDAMAGQINRLIEQNEFSGKPYEILPLLAPQGLKTKQVLLVGLGDQAKLDAGMAFRTASAA